MKTERPIMIENTPRYANALDALKQEKNKQNVPRMIIEPEKIPKPPKANINSSPLDWMTPNTLK